MSPSRGGYAVRSTLGAQRAKPEFILDLSRQAYANFGSDEDETRSTTTPYPGIMKERGFHKRGA